MRLHVNPSSDVPLYRQLYDCISTSILSGELQGGESLPAIRTVATELRISVIVVRRAWEELDRDGYISSEVGRGSFILPLSEEERKERCALLLRQELAPVVEKCHALGLSIDMLLSVLKETDLE